MIIFLVCLVVALYLLGGLMVYVWLVDVDEFELTMLPAIVIWPIVAVVSLFRTALQIALRKLKKH